MHLHNLTQHNTTRSELQQHPNKQSSVRGGEGFTQLFMQLGGHRVSEDVFVALMRQQESVAARQHGPHHTLWLSHITNLQHFRQKENLVYGSHKVGFSRELRLLQANLQATHTRGATHQPGAHTTSGERSTVPPRHQDRCVVRQETSAKQCTRCDLPGAPNPSQTQHALNHARKQTLLHASCTHTHAPCPPSTQTATSKTTLPPSTQTPPSAASQTPHAARPQRWATATETVPAWHPPPRWRRRHQVQTTTVPVRPVLPQLTALRPDCGLACGQLGCHHHQRREPAVERRGRRRHQRHERQLRRQRGRHQRRHQRQRQRHLTWCGHA